ncbi:MAG TPA: sodium/alanine symporter, partial [Cytophagales bacterium]|nr:sodium/alanine symporter [Cytophagales bacterium]
PIFQANQLTATLMEVIYKPSGWVGEGQEFNWQLGTALVLVVITSSVVFGGIKRIGDVAGRVVPIMVIIYMVSVLVILFSNFSLIDDMFALILQDAFTAEAMGGGLLGVMVKGAQRAAFSNEAGIGTAPMMHGAAKTKEPVREGLVAMLGPIIDTLVVCTLTGLAILVTGAYEFQESLSGLQGITLTAKAFALGIPGVGSYVLMICVLFFAISSMFSYSYYGVKSLGFVLGAKYGKYYNYLYVATIIWGATASIDAVVALIDSAFALMAFPTMISALILAPKVLTASRDYFARMKAQKITK